MGKRSRKTRKRSRKDRQRVKSSNALKKSAQREHQTKSSLWTRWKVIFAVLTPATLIAIVTFYLNILHPDISLTVNSNEFDLFTPIFTLENNGNFSVRVSSSLYELIGMEAENCSTMQNSRVDNWKGMIDRGLMLSSGESHATRILPIDVPSPEFITEISVCLSVSVLSCPLSLCIFPRTIERGFTASRETDRGYWRPSSCEELLEAWPSRATRCNKKNKNGAS